MVYVIIQIPCFNEEDTIGRTLDDLPRQIPGVDRLERLIIDDGCSDRTVEVARAHGVDHVVSFDNNLGLAEGYLAGIRRALDLGADIIVNTDADNQYSAKDIPALIAPILEKRADVVVGARPIMNIGQFSGVKKGLQRLGSWVVRQVSGTAVEDAPSGFRAINRNAAKRFVIYNNYTYTLETLIQAGMQNMRIVSTPVSVNYVERPSRLVKSVFNYVMRSALTILRVYIIYRPIAFLSRLAMIFAAPGLIAILRYLYFATFNEGAAHVQSLVLGTSLVAIAAMVMVAGIIADLIAANRRLLEGIRLQLIDMKEAIEKRGPNPPG